MIKKGEQNKKAQVTIFIIVAVVIVAIIILYFYFQGSLFTSPVPRNMRPVYDSYLSCVEDITEDGVYLLGEQGGYIKTPDFVPGSSYRPFSSQLDFFGQGVPYWMYVSGNNILHEQVPTKEQMASELEEYIKDRLDTCKFKDYEAQGFGVYVENGDVEVSIKDSYVEVITKNPLTIYFENDTARVNEHKVKLNVRLGKLYDMAKQLYNYEKTDMFLEKYAIDVMRLYVPVDGVELGCKPIIFNDNEIRQNLTDGLTANINFLKVKGSYYELQRKENQYFVVDPGFSADSNVNFMYSPSWPTRIEIYGDKTIQPVGMQEGLAILGFCYAPYHLVYDINFPVLIQFWEGDFFFQFPVSVIIEKNYAREALPPMFEGESLDSEVCKYKNQKMRIYTYDTNFNPLPATVEFSCLNSNCYLGETKMIGRNSVYEGTVPQCLNGFITASAPGYAKTKQLVSTNDQSTADIILRKIYTLDLDLGNIKGTAVINFNGENYATTVIYPETKSIELVEDFYNVSVLVYQNSSLTIKGIDDQKCVDVPVQGVGGMFGLTEEKCSDIKIPDMQVDYAVIGGGKNIDYVTEDTLKRSTELNLNVPIFYTPNTLEDLQKNSILVDDSPVYVSYE